MCLNCYEVKKKACDIRFNLKSQSNSNDSFADNCECDFYYFKNIYI